MEALPFSTKTRAAQIFMDLLQSISVRGWYNAGPSRDEKDALLYVSFHIHPNDADNIYEIILPVLNGDFSGVKWDIKRTLHNRFFLCPLQLSRRAEELGNFEAALDEVQQKNPEFGELAAKSLINLSRAIFERFETSGKKRFTATD